MPEIILNIETSSKACSVALAQEGVLTAEAESSGEWKHSREITLLIDRLLKDTGLGFDRISAVAVSAGPGSYTGLRVGTSVAKAICYAKEIPLVAVETLKLIAAEFANGKKTQDVSHIIPFIDARRDEVYYQVFDSDLNPVTEPDNLVLEADSLGRYRGKNVIICGDGTQKARDILGDDAFLYRPSLAHARHMAPISYRYFIEKQVSDTAYFTPFYLKNPNITRSKKPLF